MVSNIRVTVYYGPLSHFRKIVGDAGKTGLLQAVHDLDEAARRHTMTIQGQPAPEPPEPPVRPNRLVAESSDYSSLQEHVIVNFAGLIRRVNPKNAYLHNPPDQVHAQIAQIFDVTVERFEYPAIDAAALRTLNDKFGQEIVGQSRVKDALLASLYPLTKAAHTKPIVLMLYGPSGVGKTETARLINNILGGALLRKQLSMYHNERFASYLFGGTHAEPSFARELMDRESGVILLDEFDKANPVFHSAFYQLFDDGLFEDKNYKVEVGPSLIICTSNYQTEAEIVSALGEALYSRFDSLIMFAPLATEDVRTVIAKLIEGRTYALTTREKEWVQPGDLRERLESHADKFGNIRKLGKIVDEAIARRLVQGMLRGDDEPARD